MANILEYFVKGNTTGAAKSLDTLGSKFNSLGRSAAGLAGSLGLAFGLAGMVAATKRSLDLADQMEKLEKRTGITVEALSELKFAGEQSGIEFETLTKSMEKSSNAISEAASGTGEARTSLMELGLDAKKLAALKPEAQLEVLADAFTGVGESSDRTRLAMDLFGGRGAAMLQIMGGGSAEIKALRNEARELGLTLSQESAQGAAEANDAMNRLKSSMNGLSQESAINLAPAIADLANGAAEHLPAAMRLASNAFNGFRKAAFTSLSFVFKTLGVFMTKLGEYSAKLNGDLLFGDGFTKRLQNSAAQLTNFGGALKGRADDIDFVTARFEANATVLRDVHGPAIEEVASKFGMLTRQEALVAIGAEDAAAKVALLGDGEAMKKIGDGLKVNIGDTSEGIFNQLETSFKSSLLTMANDILNSNIQSAFASILGGGGGSGGAAAGATGGIFNSLKSVFGFSTGGSFKVPSFGSNAGTDKTMVSLAASPGEVVSVTPANQNRGGGGGAVINMSNVYNFEGQSAPSQAELSQFIDRRDAVLKTDIFRTLRNR